MSITVPELVLVFLSPGVAAGGSGWGIDGSGHVHKIPSNNPEAFREAAAAVTLLDLAGTVRDSKVAAQAKSLGEALLQSAAKQLAPKVAAAGHQARPADPAS
jgi:hypothetical protein